MPPTVCREVATIEEQGRGWLQPEKVARLAESVRSAGIAVLEGAIPTADLDHLALRMDFDSAHQVVTSKWKERRGFGSTEDHDELEGGHAQQGLPRSAPWVLPSIVSNPLIEQCAIALLGPCYFQTNNGNTNLPGSGTQPLHVVRPGPPSCCCGAAPSDRHPRRTLAGTWTSRASRSRSVASASSSRCGT